MGRIYTLDGKLLTGSPEVRIKDKLYIVDDRTSTVKKMMQLNTNDEQAILELAYGKKAYAEIEALDLPFQAYLEVVKLTVAAMTGEDPEEINARFQSSSQETK